MVFDRWAAQNRIPKRMLTPVDKLSFIGKRGMGAFEFVPATPGLESSSALQIDSLYQLSRRIFEEREEVSVQEDETLHLQSIYEVGTSAGGQHPKAIIVIHETTHDIRFGPGALARRLYLLHPEIFGRRRFSFYTNGNGVL